MKKLIISIFIMVATVALHAQVTTDSVLKSKKGIPILPQKGDWAIGFDAIPYLEFVGNMFNNTNNNNLYLGSQTIFGRYFISDNAAIRGIFSIDQSSSLSKHYVPDDAAVLADPLSQAKTEDTRKYNSTEYSLLFGFQKFRGYGRLKGFYGLQAGLNLERYRYFYTYGNPITSVNSAPSTYDYNTGTIVRKSDRPLEVDYGYTSSILVGGVAGVELYFMPKACIGAEVSLNFAHSWDSQGNSKNEKLNNSIVQEYEVANSPKGRNYTSLSSGSYTNYGGSLYLMFHF